MEERRKGQLTKRTVFVIVAVPSMGCHVSARAVVTREAPSPSCLPKQALLRAEEEMEQRQAATAGGVYLVPGVGFVMNHPFLVLRVNRHNLLVETLVQVRKQL